jgi:hypothetical protein
MHYGILFDMKPPAQIPAAIGAMSASALNTELEKGYNDAIAGRLHELDDVVLEMNRDYGI